MRVVIGLSAVVLAFVVGFWGSSALPEDARGFELTRVDGQVINSAEDLAGQPYLITFGYTYCPDVCPTTMAHLAAVLQAHEQQTGKAIQAIFVSVDPDRDTPEQLGQYAAYFDERIWALSGTAAQLEALKAEYSVYFAKVPGTSADDYLMDHSAGVLVLDERHRLRGVIREGESVAQSLATLAEVL